MKARVSLPTSGISSIHFKRGINDCPVTVGILHGLCSLDGQDDVWQDQDNSSFKKISILNITESGGKYLGPIRMGSGRGTTMEFIVYTVHLI